MTREYKAYRILSKAGRIVSSFSRNCNHAKSIAARKINSKTIWVMAVPSVKELPLKLTESDHSPSIVFGLIWPVKWREFRDLEAESWGGHHRGPRELSFVEGCFFFGTPKCPAEATRYCCPKTTKSPRLVYCDLLTWGRGVCRLLRIAHGCL